LSDRHGRSTLKRELDLFSHQTSFLITSTPPLDTLLPILRVYDLAKTQKREESKKIKMHRTYSMRQSRAPTVSPSLAAFQHAPDVYLRIAGERKTETDALQASQLQNPPPPPSSTKSGRLFGKGGLGQCILDISYDVASIHHHFPFTQPRDCGDSDKLEYNGRISKGN
jgi:hypothetical protein